MMHLLRRDVKDFQELSWHFNEEVLGGEGGNGFNDTASQKSAYSCGNSVISGM